MKKYLLTISLVVMVAALFTSCKKDDSPDPNKPVVTLSVPYISGKSSTSQTITVKIKSPRKIKSLVITKGINLQPDNTFGTSGALNVTDAVGKTDYEYAFAYTFKPSEEDKLVGINYKVVDEDGRATEADLTINTVLGPKDILAKYKWQLKNKLWVSLNADDTKDVDKDDVYTFNANGSMSLDYGTKRGDYDGFNVYDKWSLSADEKTLTMEYYSIFNPAQRTTEAYGVESITKDQLVIKIGYDLSWLGFGTNEIFRFTLSPMPK